MDIENMDMKIKSKSAFTFSLATTRASQGRTPEPAEPVRVTVTIP